MKKLILLLFFIFNFSYSMSDVPDGTLHIYRNSKYEYNPNIQTIGGDFYRIGNEIFKNSFKSNIGQIPYIINSTLSSQTNTGYFKNHNDIYTIFIFSHSQNTYCQYSSNSILGCSKDYEKYVNSSSDGDFKKVTFNIFDPYILDKITECKADENFNIETKECIKCPIGHWWSFQTNECTKTCELIENQKDRFECTCLNAKLGKFEGYANLQIGGITNVTYVSKKDGKTYRTSTHNCAIECQAGSIGIPVDENFVNGANYDYCFVSNSPPIPPIDNNSTDPYNPEQPKPKPYVNPSSTVKMEYGGDGVLRPKLTDKGSIEYNKEKSPTENKTETKTESEVTPVKDEKGNIIKYDISTTTSGNNYTSNLDLIAELLGHIEKNTRPYDDHNNSGGGGLPGGGGGGGKIDKDKFKTENFDAIAKLDKMQIDSVGFLSKVESEFEKVKSSLNNMIGVLKNPLSSPRSHKITTCPYKNSFTIESKIIDLEFDFCKTIQPISGVFYIFFFLSFTIMFTVFLYKFITKVLL